MGDTIYYPMRGWYPLSGVEDEEAERLLADCPYPPNVLTCGFWKYEIGKEMFGTAGRAKQWRIHTATYTNDYFDVGIDFFQETGIFAHAPPNDEREFFECTPQMDRR